MLKETDFKSYSFVQEEKIDELNGYGYVLEHKKTGARVLLIENDDTNKVFSIVSGKRSLCRVSKRFLKYLLKCNDLSG